MGERTVQEFKQTANQIVGFYKECQQARERAFVLGKQAAAVELLQLCEAMRQKERKYVNTDILLGHIHTYFPTLNLAAFPDCPKRRRSC